MKNNNAVFPGSFDPLTLGHIEIINNGLEIFQNITIAIGLNENKQYMFDINTRKQFINSVFKNENRITIKEYNLLTIDFCKQENATHIIRGVRNSIDFEYEQAISLANQELDNSITTVFIPAKKEHLFISSSIVKEIMTHKGDLTSFLPKEIIDKLY